MNFTRAGVTYWQVQFAQGSNWVPEDQLEGITEAEEHPVELLRRGRVGATADLWRMLTHVRLTGRLANVLYSMDMTGTDFYAYQFKPLVKLLHSPSTGILLADEVGLGKTIEAGLLWTELQSRFYFRRLFVLCPAVLRGKWARELRTRFGVRADILGPGDVFVRLRESISEGPSAAFAIVASIQGLRPPRGWENGEGEQGPSAELARFLREYEHLDPLIDLLVIDEAHYMRNPETMTNELGKLLRGVSQYVALLSATPIHLHSADLFQLLNLADGDLFNRPNQFDELLQANAPLVKARDELQAGRLTPESFLKNLRLAAAHPLLAGSRQLCALMEEVPPESELKNPRIVSRLMHRLESVNLLGHVLSRTRKRDVAEWRVVREAVPEMIPLSPSERAFYEAVTDVVREFAARRGAHEGFLLVTPQRQMSSCMAAALRFWQERGAPSEEELFEDTGLSTEVPTEVGPVIQELIERTRILGNYKLLRREDSKYERLRTKLREYLAEHPNEKIVLFSYFRATLRYLSERLEEDGIPTIILQGREEDKDTIIDAFKAPNGPAVLLSSEVGSEGLDLQFSRVLINYDLPWNPMRVEQRIGRLDRLGQKAQRITIWNLLHKDTIDERIYGRLYARLGIFQRALGGLEPILGERIQELTLALLRDRLTPEQEADRIRQTAVAIENRLHDEQRLEDEAQHLVAFGDFILKEIRAARELSRSINPDDLRQYVIGFFSERYPGSEFRQDPVDGEKFRASLSAQARFDLDKFVRRHGLVGQTQLTRTDVAFCDIRFENTVLRGRDRMVETVNQLHPIVRFVGEKLSEPGALQPPAVAVRVSQDALRVRLALGVYVFAVQRWSVGGVQDIERLYYAAVRIGSGECCLTPEDAERLISAAALHGEDWLSAADHVDFTEAARLANDVCLAEADKEYKAFVEERRAQNDDRADIQERSAEAHFRARRETLINVHDRHLRAGRHGLARATEGQIGALKRWLERERKRIAERRQLTPTKEDVCVGLILLE
ncbi:MAG TPA: helicase-related protein [Candidatus Acidoferrales bacterium]|nr:helicase-related protein [Candidatus Acidoferrales bacterium]